MREQLTQRPYHYMDTVYGTDVATNAVFQISASSIPAGASGAIIANVGATTIWWTGGNTVVAASIGIALSPADNFIIRDNPASLTKLRFIILNNVANGRLTWQFITE